MNWKDFLYFQKGDKLAVILLLILIVLVMVANMFLSQRNSREIVLVQNDSIVREFQEFQQSLRASQPEESERNYSNYSTRNTYPERNRTYENRPNQTENRTSSYTPFPRQEKLAEGETISLNTTDTAAWKKVPGIGSSYADRIVKYRNLLGGFASVDQLLEVYGMDGELFARISPYVESDGNFRKVQINKLEFKELLSHPYLNYKQVQVIVNLRKRKGDIVSINELAMLDEFTTEDIERLTLYLEF